MKICILGHSGCGKSTLAKKLGEQYGIPVLHLDAVHFKAGWVEREREEMKAIVGAFLDENDSWVIDGSYKKCHLERRMQEADLVIFLLFNRFTCFYRVCKRYKTYKGKTRTDMAEGCEEKLDWTFIRWVLWDGRTKERMQVFKDLMKEYKGKSVVCKTQSQLDKFLKNLS